MLLKADHNFQKLLIAIGIKISSLDNHCSPCQKYYKHLIYYHLVHDSIASEKAL